MTRLAVASLLIGAGATLAIDLWSLLLKRGLGIASLDFCLLGRWFLHMPAGTFRHESIKASPARPGECAIGWVAHYSIGISLAFAFLLLAPRGWLAQPTLGPALVFGLATTLIPLFVMQPALGLGIASAKTPRPAQARVKSLATHTVFGLGIYGVALLLSRLLPVGA